MSAILSTDFRTLNASNFVTNVVSSDDYVYIGVGKADPWDPTLGGADETIQTPENTQGYFSEAYRNLMGIVKVTTDKISHVVVRHDYTEGLSDWVAWDNNSSTIFDSKFYCLTDQSRVYKLLSVGTGSSTNKPQHVTVDSLPEADGYIWKYMYTVTTDEQEAFETTNFMSVQTAVAGGTGTELTRYNYQQESAGETGSAVNVKGITGVKIIAGGNTYANTNGTPVTLSIDGNGTGGEIEYEVTGQAVTSVTVTNAGTGYDVASVTIPGGTGAKIEFTIAPGHGHGTDPVAELGGRYVLVNAQLDGSGGGDLTVDNDFRQLTLIKNPIEADGVTPATLSTYNPVQAVIAATPGDASSLSTTDYITGSSSGAIAYVIATNGSTGYIYYTQNSKTGYDAFDDGEPVTGSVTGSNVTLSTPALATDVPEIKLNSGEILLVDNIAPVTRGNNQTEDVKMVIEF